MLWISESVLRSLFLSLLLVGFGLAFALRLPPLSVLPADQADISGMVETVLQAQAAMMAISLAVMAFLVGGVRRHEDMDDRLYEWFLTKAFVRPVFALTAFLTLGTTAAFFMTKIWDTCAIPNLTLFAGGSMGLAVLVIISFALWALRILRPSQYRTFKAEVTTQAVKDAAVAYAKFLSEIRAGEAPDGGRGGQEGPRGRQSGAACSRRH